MTSATGLSLAKTRSAVIATTSRVDVSGAECHITHRRNGLLHVKAARGRGPSPPWMAFQIKPGTQAVKRTAFGGQNEARRHPNCVPRLPTGEDMGVNGSCRFPDPCAPVLTGLRQSS